MCFSTRDYFWCQDHLFEGLRLVLEPFTFSLWNLFKEQSRRHMKGYHCVKKKKKKIVCSVPKMVPVGRQRSPGKAWCLCKYTVQRWSIVNRVVEWRVLNKEGYVHFSSVGSFWNTNKVKLPHRNLFDAFSFFCEDIFNSALGSLSHTHTRTHINI